MTLAVGTKIGRYEIRSKIGAGGMGEVYLAQDTELDRKVALKILPAEVANWLERGLEQRDPKMVFLKVEPKWDNLRSDQRFADLLRRVGF